MRTFACFVACCAIAALAPLFARQKISTTESIPFPGWPAQIEGRVLTELPLSARERQLADGFPGRIARFTDGSNEIIIRWVTKETRALHPSADCFRGTGYSIHPLPLTIDATGNRWGAFEARRGEESLIVHERIYSTESGESWADISSWYWQAMLGQSKGGWWAVTIAQSQNP